MKYIFIVLCLLCSYCNNLYSQIVVKQIDTTIIAKYPVVKLNNTILRDSLDKIILKHNYQKLPSYKDFVYTIFSKKDSINNSIDIYISLVPISTIETKEIEGIYSRKKILFFIENKTSLFLWTNKYKSLKYKKRVGFIQNNKFYKTGSEMYNPPIWIFRYENNRLNLLISDFLPRESK